MALTISPSFVAVLLLNSPLDTPAGLVIGRITGAALVALATDCWLAECSSESRRTGLDSGHVAL